MCATCCKINCLSWDNKSGTWTITKNRGRKTFEETLGNFTQGSPCHNGREYSWLQNRGSKKGWLLKKLPFVKSVGKTTLLLCIRMFITAPVLSYSSPNIDDSWHNSLIYWWVSLGLDKLWCNSDRMIVTWIFNTAHLGREVLISWLRHYILFPQSISLIRLFPYQS